MVQASGVDIPSRDFPFSIVGRGSCTGIAWGCVRGVEINKVPVGESLEAMPVAACVKVLSRSRSPQADAEWVGSVRGCGACTSVWIIEGGEGAIGVTQEAVGQAV